MGRKVRNWHTTIMIIMGEQGYTKENSRGGWEMLEHPGGQLTHHTGWMASENRRKQKQPDQKWRYNVAVWQMEAWVKRMGRDAEHIGLCLRREDSGLASGDIRGNAESKARQT
jgi:hypothetical protein